MDYGEDVYALAFTSLKSIAGVGNGNIRSTGLTDGEYMCSTQWLIHK